MTDFNKVFGIGLSKTGTTSLGLALNQMGVLTKDFPHDPVTLAQLEAGDFRLKLLERFDAITDTPVVPYYPQFDKLYPGSKFILTVREMDSWLRSICDHWAERDAWLQIAPVQRRFAYFINTAVYGSIGFNKERFRYVYERHVREVRRYFADRPGDLLEINICAGDKMGRLGAFLGLDVPDEEFPRANTRDERHRTDAWVAYLHQMVARLDQLLPVDAVIAWVDECQLVGLAPRTVRHAHDFPSMHGQYQGTPADDQQAIKYLHAAIRQGAHFLVFIDETRWWLHYYKGFAEHLAAHHRCIYDDGKMTVFDIRSDGPRAPR